MELKNILLAAGSALAVGTAALIIYPRHSSQHSAETAQYLRTSEKIRTYSKQFPSQDKEYSLVIAGKDVTARIHAITNSSLLLHYRINELDVILNDKGIVQVSFHNQPITNPDIIRNATDFGAKILEDIINLQSARK